MGLRDIVGTGFRRCGLAFASAALGWILALSPAQAQEPSGTGGRTATEERARGLDAQADQDSAEARATAAFDEAELAWSERRLADAARLLEESLRLDPVASTAFNLARVLAEMGRPTASTRYFNALLDGEYGPLAAPQAADVRERLTVATAAFARILVRAEGPGSARVRVDGESVGQLTADAPVQAEVDPGTHRIIARLSHTDLEETVVVQRGEERSVLFNLPAAPEPEGESDSVLLSPVFWTVVGVVVIGAVVATVLLAPGEPDQVSDPVFGILEALHGE